MFRAYLVQAQPALSSEKEKACGGVLEETCSPGRVSNKAFDEIVDEELRTGGMIPGDGDTSEQRL